MNTRPADSLAIALAQLNPTVGDVAGNAEKVRRARAEAAAKGADVVAFPELFIAGYPPEDLVLKPAFQAACRAAIEALARETADGGPAILIGTPWLEGGKLFNAVALADRGRITNLQFKVDLPNYGVFDEKRVFVPGPMPGPVNFRGVRLGIPICEDIWGNLGPLTTRPEPSLDQLKGMLASRPDAWDAKAAMAAREAGAQALLDHLEVPCSVEEEGHLVTRGARAVWGSLVPAVRDFMIMPFGNGFHLDRRLFDRRLATVAAERAIVFAVR